MKFRKTVNTGGIFYELKKTETSLTFSRFSVESDNGRKLLKSDLLLEKDDEETTKFIVIDCGICYSRKVGQSGIAFLTKAKDKNTFGVCYVGWQSTEFQQLYNFKTKRFHSDGILFLKGPSLLWASKEENALCFVSCAVDRSSSKLKLIRPAVFFGKKDVQINKILFSKLMRRNCSVIVWKYFFEGEEKLHGFLLHEDSADEFNLGQLIPKEYCDVVKYIECLEIQYTNQKFQSELLVEVSNSILRLKNGIPLKFYQIESNNLNLLTILVDNLNQEYLIIKDSENSLKIYFLNDMKVRS